MSYYTGPTSAEYKNNKQNAWYQKRYRIKLPKIAEDELYLTYDYGLWEGNPISEATVDDSSNGLTDESGNALFDSGT